MKRIALLFVTLSMALCSHGKVYKHPGLNNTIEDLDFIKAKVEAKEQPWYGAWKNMTADSKAKSTYTTPGSQNGDIGGSDGNRQRASRDAMAAYFNMLQWYVTGNEAHAKCAVNILNKWTQTVTQQANEQLFQLPIISMVEAAELCMLYDGWEEADREAFKTMCVEKWYPGCKAFLGKCGSWPGWDGPANLCCLAIGILTDNEEIVDEAVRYYKYGNADDGFGGGRLSNMIFDPCGASVEMGRDLPHAEIGLDAAAELCEIMWNQGVDLWALEDNLLLQGFENLFSMNLSHQCQWKPYDDCANPRLFSVSLTLPYRITGFPGGEAVYNHYVNRRHLDAPYTTANMRLRGLQSYSWEAANYTMLTYMEDGCQDIVNAKLGNPGRADHLEALPAIEGVRLKWSRPDWTLASGSVIQRTEAGKDNWADIYTYTNNTSTEYTDKLAADGIRYEYRVALKNLYEQGEWSVPAVADKASVLTEGYPDAWKLTDIGNKDEKGEALYYEGNSRNIKLVSRAGNMGGNSANDNFTFLYRKVTGSFTIEGRIYDISRCDSRSDIFGIMIRESLAGGARMAAVGHNNTDARYVYMMERRNASASSTFHGGDTHCHQGGWLRMVREGSKFTAYQRFREDEEWHEIYSTTMTGFATTCYIGLFASRGWDGAQGETTVSFDNVSVYPSSGSTQLNMPQNFRAARTTATKAVLCWDEVEGASAYTLMATTTGDDNYVTIADALTATEFTHSGLDANTAYSYRLIAKSLASASEPATLDIQTAVMTLPGIPQGIKATSNGTHAFVDWYTEDDADTYNVYRSADKQGKYDNVAAVGRYSWIEGAEGRIGWLDETSLLGQTYYYKVCAENAMGEGLPSDTVGIKVALQSILQGDAVTDGNDGTRITIDLGEGNASVVTQVRYKPTMDHLQKFTGTEFLASNEADFAKATLLYTVHETPASSAVWTRQSIYDTTPYRYLRLVSPTAGITEAEFQFFGIAEATTGIANTGIATDCRPKAMYTLDGRKADNVTRGVVVVDGKKVISHTR